MTVKQTKPKDLTTDHTTSIRLLIDCSRKVRPKFSLVGRNVNLQTSHQRIFCPVSNTHVGVETPRWPSREELCSIVARCPDTDLISLVNDLVDSDAFESLSRVRDPQIGTVQIQIREPICRERFILADALVTIAEVMINQSIGWAMRLGANVEATTAAAIIDGWISAPTGDPSTKQRAIDTLLSVHRRDSYERELHHQDILATAIEFEELD